MVYDLESVLDIKYTSQHVANVPYKYNIMAGLHYVLPRIWSYMSLTSSNLVNNIWFMFSAYSWQCSIERAITGQKDGHWDRQM